jgi:hypothetical protein
MFAVLTCLSAVPGLEEPMRNPSRLHQTVVMLMGMVGVCGVVSAASLDAEAAQFMPQRMSPVSSRSSHTLAFI